MGRKILINADHPEESRVAIVEDGVLLEYEVEFTGREQNRGNIYKGTVCNIVPALQAAFVDYGGGRPGFLQMGDINPRSLPAETEVAAGEPRRIEKILHLGQELLVQVVKDARSGKGAALTTEISLPGRFMVIMPYGDARGISRKIDDETQRKKLREIIESLNLPESVGYIIRTAAIGQKKEELKKDIDYLRRIYEKVLEKASQCSAPALIYQESNLVIRFLRDYFSVDMDQVLVDNPRVYQEAVDFFRDTLPDYADLVKLHREQRPIFSRYQLEEQIAAISRNKVPLPSGGSIVIDSTEALVAIDVNSGKTIAENDIEATALRTNLEAAAEIARQLRLRDLGGLIVVDFIDMRESAHIREVEKKLKEAAKKDKARINLARMSKFCLLEMSRQRIRPMLGEQSLLPCPHCQGSGRIRRVEAQAVAIMRRITAALFKGDVGLVDVEVPLEVAFYLLNERREALRELEQQHQVRIVLRGRADVVPDYCELSITKREKSAEASETAAAAEAPDAVAATAVPEMPSASQAPEKEEDAETPKKKASRRGRGKRAQTSRASAQQTKKKKHPEEEMPEEDAARTQPSLESAAAVTTLQLPEPEERLALSPQDVKALPAPSEPTAASVEAVETPVEAQDEAASGALADSEAPAKETEQAPEEERAPRRRKRSGTRSRSRKSAKTAREETPEISPLPETAPAEPEPVSVEEAAAPPDSTEVQAVKKRTSSRRSARWWHGNRRKSKKAENKDVPAERLASDPEPSA
jgi:ribonuclease E